MVFSLFRSKDHSFVTVSKKGAKYPLSREQAKIARLSRKERVERAFEEMPLDVREMEAICALLDYPATTAVELSRACDWMDMAWRTQMLLLCQRRRKYLYPEGMNDDVTNGIIITALADYDSSALTFAPRKDLIRSLRKAVKNAL